MRPGRSIAGPLFVSPWAVGFLLLVAYPFGASFVWSFCEYDLLSSPTYVGFDNYERLADELLAGVGFGQALWNTAYYAAVSVPLSIALGIGLATMLSWPVRGRAVFRTLFYLPAVLPAVATSILWMWLLDPQRGLVNEVLTGLGIPGPGWLNSVGEAAWPPNWWSGAAGCGSKDALVLMGLWGVGNSMLIYLAALGEIPRELYEAAELDGAGSWRRFRHVTLPQLTPVIFFNLVLGLIHALQAFTQVYLVSRGQGDPGGSTLLLSLHLFHSAFKYLDMGYASALAWAVFSVVLLVTLALFRSTRFWVYYRA